MTMYQLNLRVIFVTKSQKMNPLTILSGSFKLINESPVYPLKEDNLSSNNLKFLFLEIETNCSFYIRKNVIGKIQISELIKYEKDKPVKIESIELPDSTLIKFELIPNKRGKSFCKISFKFSNHVESA